MSEKWTVPRSEGLSVPLPMECGRFRVLRGRWVPLQLCSFARVHAASYPLHHERL